MSQEGPEMLQTRTAQIVECMKTTYAGLAGLQYLGINKDEDAVTSEMFRGRYQHESSEYVCEILVIGLHESSDISIASQERIRFKFIDGLANITLTFTLFEIDEVQCLKSAIKKTDASHVLPLGLGAELYTKIVPQFCSAVASQRDVSVLHLVGRGSVQGDSLEPKRWDALFVPILENLGYENSTEDGEVHWQKIYQPTE